MSDRICLIVDDEQAIRTYLRAILQRERIQSLEADTAAQALSIIHKLVVCGAQINHYRA